MKVTVVGGGSSYTPELVQGFLDRVSTLPVSELWLMDISAERLDVVGRFAERMVEAKGRPFAVRTTTDQREAVQGAQFVITQIRVGGMRARREDEYLGKRHGLVGQETTGIGGMANAMRTIPVILNLAHDVHQFAPDALLINFTNPSGLVTEALSRYAPEVSAVGVCNAPITTKMEILQRLGELRGEEIVPERVQIDTLGLNHLTWYRGATLDGVDIWREVLDSYITELESKPEPQWDPQLIRILGVIPNGYLQYYYETARKVAAQEKWPPSRAEEVMQIEAELLDQYAEPDRTTPPESLMKRGGAYYSSVALQLIVSYLSDGEDEHVVNVRHAGAVPGWPEDWVLEMPCAVGGRRIRPLPATPLPAVSFGLMAHVKAYEILTAQAAVEGDRRAAYEALLVHPLGPAASEIQQVLDDLLDTNRALLPAFWS